MPVKTTAGAALASSFKLCGQGALLSSVSYEVDPSAPNGTYYVLVFNAAAVPAPDGAVSLVASQAVDHTSGVRDQGTIRLGDEDFGGVRSTVGFAVALSSTRPTKTESGAYLWLQTASFQ